MRSYIKPHSFWSTIQGNVELKWVWIQLEKSYSSLTAAFLWQLRWHQMVSILILFPIFELLHWFPPLEREIVSQLEDGWSGVGKSLKIDLTFFSLLSGELSCFCFHSWTAGLNSSFNLFKISFFDSSDTTGNGILNGEATTLFTVGFLSFLINYK